MKKIIFTAIMGLVIGVALLITPNYQPRTVEASNSLPVQYVQGESAFTSTIHGGERVITGLTDWTIHSGYNLHLIIPSEISGETVFAIHSNAFGGQDITTQMQRIVGVTFPDTLTEIRSGAFWGNILTGNIVIPESVNLIGSRAFSENDITSLQLPNQMTTIASGAFSNNNISGNITVPTGITNLEFDAFRENQITGVTLQEGLTTIGNNAFRGNSIAEVITPNSLVTLGVNAFHSSAVNTVQLNNGLITIGGGAFFSNSISTIRIPNSVTSIGAQAFDGSTEPNRYVMIPESVTTLGRAAFGSSVLPVANRNTLTLIERATPHSGWYVSSGRWDDGISACPIIWNANSHPTLTISHENGNSSMSTGQIDWHTPQAITFTSPKGITDIYIGGQRATELSGRVRDHTERWTLSALTGNSVTLDLTHVAHNLTIEVISDPIVVTGISIASNTTPLTGWWSNQQFVPSGIVLTVTHSYGPNTTQSDMTLMNIEPVKWEAGTMTINVTYAGQTTYFTVSVANPTITGATLVNHTVNPSWYLHQEHLFNVTDIEIELSWTYGNDTKTTTGYRLEYTWAVGEVIVRVYYGTHFAGYFTINVKPNHYVIINGQNIDITDSVYLVEHLPTTIPQGHQLIGWVVKGTTETISGNLVNFVGMELVLITEPIPSDDDFPWLIIGIAAGILALGLIVFLVTRKRKS